MANMARLVVCVLALLGAGVLASPRTAGLIAEKSLAQRQQDLTELYFHIHEPNRDESCKLISTTWSFEKNLKNFNDVGAVKTYMEMLEHEWVLPQGVPFMLIDPTQNFEAVTLFKILFSAKDYDTFYKTAVYFRDHVNENLFIYVLNVAILNRQDTQGVRIPPIYEILPSLFNNAEIMTTANRVNTHGLQMIDYYPKTYLKNNSIVIRWNETIWPYYNSESSPVAYFTNDYELNAFYYNAHLVQPYWLGGEKVPLVKDRRGESFWFLHKQLLSRYYMERLSNCLGEIPQIGHEIVKNGYTSGLMYHAGISFPVRPNYFHLNQPDFTDELQEINDYERRIRDAIEKGYVVNSAGEHTSLRTIESIDVLGRMIEANIDSPDGNYYKDFISIWKHLLGNPQNHYHYNEQLTLTVPTVMDNYQTALRDPAFYMIWKRVFGLFELWQDLLPKYKPEELALPSVSIEKVDVDKLLTYFEYTYLNVTQALPMNELEAAGLFDQIDVLVEYPRLNHKKFQVRVHVKSEAAKNVVVRFFLAPKYDSQGTEIPLHVNSDNFYMLDEFLHELPAGQSVITRDSDDNLLHRTMEPISCVELYEDSYKAVHGSGQLVVDLPENFVKMPQHLLLPKGRVSGMPFVLMVHITDYHKPKVPMGTGFDPKLSLGLGSGARHLTDDPLGFPFNRNLYAWQVEDLTNMMFEDVLIYHKNTPEVQVPHIV